MHFIIVGASVAGLATAVALKKAGHGVQLLEKAVELQLGRSSLPVGSARMPPNGSKILFDWGLHEEGKSMEYNPSVGAAFFTGFRYEGKGPNRVMDLMGYQSYSEEMLEHVRGHFLILRYADLINVLDKLLRRMPSPPSSSPFSSSTRTEHIRFNAQVTSLDLDACSVTLATGETLYADAIIGADGLDGVVRAALRNEAATIRDREEDEYSDDSASIRSEILKQEFWFYSGMIPPEDVARIEPAILAPYLGHGQGIFFGHNRTALLLGMGNQLSLCIIVNEGGHKTISDSLGPECDAVIRELAAYADANTECPIAIRRTGEHGQLDSWVSHSGRVAVLGEAAHPFTPFALQSYACAVEDGAFLGKIFSHTDDPKRVPELLHAFQEHRQPRTDFLRSVEEKYLVVLTVPNGEQQKVRDVMFRANHARGLNLLDVPPELEGSMIEAEAMEETRQVFDYDPEDDADEWWINWGRYHKTGSGPHARKDPTGDVPFCFSEAPITQVTICYG